MRKSLNRYLSVAVAMCCLVSMVSAADPVDPEDEWLPEDPDFGLWPSPQLSGPLRLQIGCVAGEPVIRLVRDPSQQAHIKFTESRTDSSVVYTLECSWLPVAYPPPAYLGERDTLYLIYVYHSDSAVFRLHRATDSAESRCYQIDTIRKAQFIAFNGSEDSRHRGRAQESYRRRLRSTGSVPKKGGY